MKVHNRSIYTKATTSYNRASQSINKATAPIDNEIKDIVSLKQQNNHDVGSVNTISSGRIVDDATAAILQQGDNLIPATGNRQSFFESLKDTVAAKFHKLKRAEKASTAAVRGDEDMMEVMAAVNEASITLEQVVAVRDKFVNAYNEIMKMSL